MIKKENIGDISMLESEKPGFKPEELELARKQSLLVLKGCTRHVLIGHKRDIHDISLQIKTPTTFYRGADAYKQLLCYVTGLFSNTRGESQIVFQFRKSWNEFREAHPENAEVLSNLHDAILADNALIRSRVTHELRPAFYESVAHRLAKHQPWEPELLVVGANRTGSGPSEVTMNIAKQLIHSKEVKPLIVTHPDPALLNVIVAKMRQAHTLKNLRLEKLPYRDAFDTTGGMRGVRVIYSALSMDEYPEADRIMARACNEQEGLGGRLIHLGGPTKSDRFTRGVWKTEPLEYAVMPENILHEQQQAKKHNEELVMAGIIAAENCAISRLNGVAPLKNIITKPPKEYAHYAGFLREGRTLS